MPLDVSIIDGGMTTFGEKWTQSLEELAIEAGTKAFKYSGLGPSDIDAVYIGNMAGGYFNGQEHLASLISHRLNLNTKPAVRCEGACASGSLALVNAIISIKSGIYEKVLVIGVEKMTDISPERVTTGLAMASDANWESWWGATFPGLYALVARRHMFEYGTTEEQMAYVAVKNHENGLKNEKAQFRTKITVENVLNSTMVADPLKLLDCSPITDGAVALIIARSDIAKQYTDMPIKFLGFGQGTDSISLHDRSDLTTFKATVAAARMAYKMAGVSQKDIDFVELHDCFTIAEIVATEDLGFFEKGQGGKAAEEGITRLDGKIPVNPSGGLKSKGHPVGATGVAQVWEVMMQLRERAGARQVKDAEIGMTHNVGGSGGTAVVNILGRDF